MDAKEKKSQQYRLRRINGRLAGLIRDQLWAKVLLGLLLGALTGAILGPSVGWVEPELSKEIAEWLALPGVIFIKLIKLIMIPLVISSIMLGLLSSESIDQLRRLGVRVAGYFVLTTALAIVIGLVLAYAIDPGASFLIPEGISEAKGTPPSTLNFTSIPAFISGMLPDNLFSTIVQAEMLGIIIASLLFGIAVFSLDDRYAAPVIKLLGAVQEISMIVVGWSMRMAPYAVFGLLAKLTAQTGVESLQSIALYVVTVVMGLALLLVFYMLMVAFVAGRNPFQFLSQIKEVQLLAFSTSSSAAVMPLSMKTAEEKLGVRRSISQFIIPIGATVNMDGTALYQGVAAVFLAQAYQIDLSMPSLVLMVVTVVLASIGTPATPGVGIIILATVLQQAGIPTEGIALILGVDRILDMCRTTMNVTGDLTSCVVFDRWLKLKGSGETTP